MSVFNRVGKPTTFADIKVGGYFRLDAGGGQGSYFLRTAVDSGSAIWISDRAGAFRPGSMCWFPPEAKVTPASFKWSDDD